MIVECVMGMLTAIAFRANVQASKVGKAKSTGATKGRGRKSTTAADVDMARDATEDVNENERGPEVGEGGGTDVHEEPESDLDRDET